VSTIDQILNDAAADLRRWAIIDGATRTTDAVRSWWAFDYAARRLDRATNVASVPTMGRAIAAMLEPAGRKRAGGANHGGPFGRGASQSQTVADTALVIAWRAGGYAGIPNADLVRRTADAIRCSGAYAIADGTASARIGEHKASASGLLDTGYDGNTRPSVYGLLRLVELGIR